MIHATHNQTSPRTSRHALSRDLAAAGVLQIIVAGGTAWVLSLPLVFPLGALGLYGAMAGLLVAARPPLAVPGGLGLATRVTLARATLILTLVPLVWFPPVGPVSAWWIVVLAGAAMVLDGVDGWTARRTRSATPFGARFDMELDTVLLLVLALLVWRSGRAGIWVIGIGVLRYLFVAACGLWPWMKRELPPSRRRQTVCVMAGVALLLCLTPDVPEWLVAPIAGGGLATLAASFAVDVRWLFHAGRQ